MHHRVEGDRFLGRYPTCIPNGIRLCTCYQDRLHVCGIVEDLTKDPHHWSTPSFVWSRGELFYRTIHLTRLTLPISIFLWRQDQCTGIWQFCHALESAKMGQTSIREPHNSCVMTNSCPLYSLTKAKNGNNFNTVTFKPRLVYPCRRLTLTSAHISGNIVYYHFSKCTLNYQTRETCWWIFSRLPTTCKLYTMLHFIMESPTTGNAHVSRRSIW